MKVTGWQDIKVHELTKQAWSEEIDRLQMLFSCLFWIKVRSESLNLSEADLCFFFVAVVVYIYTGMSVKQLTPSVLGPEENNSNNNKGNL